MSSTNSDLQMLLLETYIEESREQLNLLDSELSRARTNWGVTKRISHTLKGSARAVGLRSAERAAMQMEQICRMCEDYPGDNAQAKKKVIGLANRVRYWSNESTARKLFGTQPGAIIWCRDMRQGILYKTLLDKEGYNTTPVDDLAALDQIMTQVQPAALMLILESAKEYLNSIFDIIIADPDWINAPAIVFSEKQFKQPSQVEIFIGGTSIAPGSLMVALGEIREASS